MLIYKFEYAAVQRLLQYYRKTQLDENSTENHIGSNEKCCWIITGIHHRQFKNNIIINSGIFFPKTT